jgi:hypothetical protein
VSNARTIITAGYPLAYSWDTLKRVIGGVVLAAFVLFVLAVGLAVRRSRARGIRQEGGPHI